MKFKSHIKWMVYYPRHVKLTDENIVRFMLPSILGSIICIVSLFGLTWAWFTSSVTAPAQTIRSASYSVDSSIAEASKNPDGSFSLEANKEYVVTLTAGGSASTGYTVIKLNDAVLFQTEQINKGESLAFTFIPETPGEYFFMGIWGTFIGEASIKNGDTIGIKKESGAKAPSSSIESEGTESSTDPETSQISPEGSESSTDPETSQIPPEGSESSTDPETSQADTEGSESP